MPWVFQRGTAYELVPSEVSVSTIPCAAFGAETAKREGNDPRAEFCTYLHDSPYVSEFLAYVSSEAAMDARFAARQASRATATMTI